MCHSSNAASVAIFNDQRVLLIQRAKAPYAGYWTLPGGKREADEDADQCAKREIDEELNVTLDALVEVTRLNMSVNPPYVLAVFAARVNEIHPTASREIADWQWCSLSKVKHLKTTPGLLEVIEQANQSLTGT